MPRWNERPASQAEVDVLVADVAALEDRQRYTWRSDLVTSASIVGGAATEQIVLAPAFPANAEIVNAYFQVMTAAASANVVNTATVTFQLGITGVLNGYIAAGVNMFTFTGYPSAFAGSLVGGIRAADTPRLTLTCTGAAPDTADVTNLGVYAFVEYFLPRSAD